MMIVRVHDDDTEKGALSFLDFLSAFFWGWWLLVIMAVILLASAAVLTSLITLITYRVRYRSYREQFGLLLPLFVMVMGFLLVVLAYGL